ncbi:MAG: universal stress protein [Tannerella sp.]|jgi:nucleotide-binding universal stress UspA family protein|nr:universal stress protein [Tannerella sp.]
MEEEKLVTLAIHTYEKAQILKTILESEGIDVYIHNVNLIQPVISAGVRVRIKESQLPHALRVINDVKWQDNSEVNENTVSRENTILIPVDFSDYSLKACEIGFNYAHRTGAEVMLLHVYFNTFIPSVFPYLNNEVNKHHEDESIHVVYRRVKEDVGKLCGVINRKIHEGELPAVKYDYTLREGLPEEEIIAYVREHQPTMIVMGTRGMKQKNADLIGSVTGEVIGLTKTPLLAVPEHIPFNDLGKIQRLAFGTSFRPDDLVAFDKLAELMKDMKNLQIQLFNISTSHNEWNEIRLTGFREYLKKQYPDLTIDYAVTPDGDLPEAIDRLVKEQQIDIIAFSARRRGVIMRVFSPSIAHKMLFHSNTPLMVVPV